MKKIKNSKGFSLLEILISLIILAIALLAMASLMTTTTQSNAFGGHMTEAATFAQDKLESLRVTSWNDIESGNDTIQGATGIIYNRVWTVEIGPNSPPFPNDNEKRIMITVNWNDGVPHSISFLSVITR